MTRVRNPRRKKGRIRLEYREIGGTWCVGYWDGTTGDPGRDFRSMGQRRTRDEAHLMLLDILRKDGRYY